MDPQDQTPPLPPGAVPLPDDTPPLPAGATLLPADDTPPLPRGAVPIPSGGAKDQPSFLQHHEDKKATVPIVAPGHTDDEIIKSFGYDPAVIKKSPAYQWAVKNYGSGFKLPLLEPTTDPSYLSRSPVGAAGMGVFDVGAGALQLLQHARGALGFDREDTPYVDLLMRHAQENYKQNIASKPTLGGSVVNPLARVAGNALATMWLPGSKLAAAEGTVPRIAGGALLGAETGALQPVTEGAPDNYAAQKGWQIGGGGVAGGVVSGALPPLVKFPINTIRRVVNGFRTPLPKTEALALQDLLKTRMQGSWGNIDDVRQAAAAGTGPGAGRAAEALEAVTNAGNDPEAVAQAAIKLQDFRTAEVARGLYDKVDQLAAPLGDVPLTKGQGEIDHELAQLKAQKAENSPLEIYLQGIKSRLTPQAPAPAGPPPTNIQDYLKWKAAQQPPVSAGNTYQAIRQLTSDLGDRIRAEKQGTNAMLGTRAAGVLQQVKDALEADMLHFTNTSSPELATAANDANQYYRDVRIPFKDRTIAKAGTTDEPDTIFGTLIKGGRADLAQKFYNALDPKGRAAAQYQMVNKAIKDSTDPVTGFDPAALTRSIEKFKDNYGVFFTGQDQAALDGIQKLATHAAQIDRSVYPRLSPRVLWGTSGALEATMAMAHLLPKAPHLGVTGFGLGLTPIVIEHLLTTPAGRKFLYGASGLQPGSAAMGRLWGQLQNFMPAIARGAGAWGAQNAQQEQQPIVVSSHPSFNPDGQAKGGLVHPALNPPLGVMRRHILRSLGPPGS